MKIFRSLSERPKNPSSVTMGSFDGVHRGHRVLIERTVAAARKKNLSALALTYEPHPRVVLGDPTTVRLLTVLPEKLFLFEKFGLDETLVYPFDRTVAGMEPEEFVERILVEGLGARHLVVGYDHRFGKARRGNIALLEKLAVQYSFELEVLEPVRYSSETVKSSSVREFLSLGRFDLAVELLGHPFPIYGRKAKGHGRGRKLGYPTFNLALLPRKLLPAPGIYAARAVLGTRFLDGMLYIGTSPTFGEAPQSVEINILDGEVELGSESLALAERFIRRDEKFGSAEELTAKMKMDETTIRQYLAAQGKVAAAGRKGGLWQ
ncbi:MAG: riboflavin biosynthesis protein RibF [candidate division Zixibacteria bacterium]|nr:riboflavin biosynthesis protein RibF [candidate division Zixibacteria bacterium]MCI0596846.1 riboflavin biosynthesis protein RibF [candidate division Zixibacteria bacterium]